MEAGQKGVRAENPQDGNNLFMMQNSNRAPHTHTPPPPAPPPPLPTCTTSFLISDYIDSTCFGMLNSPYNGIAIAITKGQQSSTLRFLNRALSQHEDISMRESTRVSNMQFIEPIFDISLLSSTVHRHEIQMISLENLAGIPGT